MSHLSRIAVKVTDLNVLSRACERLGATLNKSKKQFNWYYRTSPCDAAIQMKDTNYEIGVTKEKGKQEYKLEGDFYGGIAKVIGQDGNLLKQAYTIEMAKYQAMMKGYSCLENKQKDGSIKLTINLPS